jgi:MurNAc alpha-1-phosphate uridylyltransferase
VSKLDKAMILAAGFGERMRPITNAIPKPLVPVMGRTLLDHSIDRLVQGGVKLVVVNVHYLADQIVTHLKARTDVEIRICDETDRILDSGGGIAKALPHFNGEPFFAYNSDTLWVEGASHAIERMRARWNESEMDGLMLLAPTVTAIGYEGDGDFEMTAAGLISRRPERKLTPFVYTGLQILHPRLFENAPKGKFPIHPLWHAAMDAKRLHGVRLDGVWVHVGTPQGLHDAEAFLRDLWTEP